jgi:hypothetical protein
MRDSAGTPLLPDLTAKRLIALALLVNAAACAPYRVLPHSASARGGPAVFCEGPGSSHRPDGRGAADCFHVDRTTLERFMNGQLRL